MEAGSGYGHWCTEGTAEIEIVSEDQTMLETLKNVVTGTIARAASGASARIETKLRSYHGVGDSMRNTPLTDLLRSVLQKLRIKSETVAISEKVSMLNEHGIPATAIGITRGKSGLEEDCVELGPVISGFRQLLLLVETSASAILKREG
jgi:hypothetical protein